jgi:hypothetical protein
LEETIEKKTNAVVLSPKKKQIMGETKENKILRE